MALNRLNIEKRIIEILSYIDNDTLAFPLKQNISLFSLKELEKLLEFLERWNIKIIYKLLDEKYKEYLWLIEELKTIKINEKKEQKLIEENSERKEEEKELEKLINF